MRVYDTLVVILVLAGLLALIMGTIAYFRELRKGHKKTAISDKHHGYLFVMIFGAFVIILAVILHFNVF